MISLFNKYTAIVFLGLSTCLAQAADLSDCDSNMEGHDRDRGSSIHARKQDHHFSDESSSGYVITFKTPLCFIERSYDKNHVPIETQISASSREPISSEMIKQVVRIIFCMDSIEMSKRHEHSGFIQEHKPVEHIHRYEHPEGLIHELVNEVRGIGRDCIEAMPRPIGYFLGFWPIRTVLNRVFPHHQHKHL